MTKEAGSILLGLLASFLFAAAAFLQQRAARETEQTGRSVVRSLVNLIRKLLRHPVWLLGWFVNLCSFGVQALALHLGSVATVQPLLATQLLFALPMSSLERRRWPSPRDWSAGLAICGGLVLLYVVVDVEPVAGAVDRGRLELAVGCAVALIAVVVPIAYRMRHEVMTIAGSPEPDCCWSWGRRARALTVGRPVDQARRDHSGGARARRSG